MDEKWDIHQGFQLQGSWFIFLYFIINNYKSQITMTDRSLGITVWGKSVRELII